MRKMICFFLCMIILTSSAYAISPEEVLAPSYILIEAGEGKVLTEGNVDERRPIASVTKVMTMLLIAEAVDSGRITLDDMVSVSQHAMDMGGSTMFLEAGETLSVNDMLKGIAVASANDGCVAMAEFLEGTEAAFVAKMNERAKALGMENTNFVNTNGLDDDNHYSTARDVAIMSAELLKHEFIFNYTTIWTDSLRGGKFELANTNKLIRFYDGANGLKTGSTSKAGCCLCASAKRNDMQLVAVVLGAKNSKDRFASARALLDYGFASYKVDTIAHAGDSVTNVNVAGGVVPYVTGVLSEDVSVLCEISDTSEVEIEILPDELKAPVYVNSKIGSATIKRGGEPIRTVDILASATVEKKTFFAWLLDSLRSLCL